MSKEQRKEPRKHVGLLVRLQHANVDNFVEQYATNVSSGGMFIRSKTPQAVGTAVRFEVQLSTQLPVFRGTGTVRWVRAVGDPDGPPGMGVQFDQLDEASRKMLARILEKKAATPAPVAPPEPAQAPSSAPSDFSPPSIAPLTFAAAAAPLPAIPPIAPELPPPPPPSEDDIDLDMSSLLESAAPAVPAQPAPQAKAPQQRPAAEPIPTPVLDSSQGKPRLIVPPKGKTAYLPEPGPIDPTGPVLGIDLGTTNSCVAVMENGRPAVLSSKDGHNTIPSIISLSAQGKLMIGHRARSQLLMNPQQTVYGAKRLVGHRFDSATVNEVRERFHYEIVPDADGKAAVALGGKVVSLEEAQAMILVECKEIAQQRLGRPVHRAVITCPAYYSERQREAVRKAGALAGLKVERVLNEPTAAALAFGLNRQLTRKIMVYDMGGGTFDATILKVQNNVFEVLATGGDIFLGGVDFDSALVDLCIARFQDASGMTFSGDSSALARVNDVAERAKVALSESKTFDVHVPMLMVDPKGKAHDLKTTLTRKDLEDCCGDLVQRTLDVVRDVLLDAKLKATELDGVLLVGGQSRMPLVREKLHQLLGKSPHAGVNADEAVALGAALLAGTVDRLTSVVLIDVLPVTIGIGVPGGKFQRAIERNTPLPAKAVLTVTNNAANERVTEVFLFQGESRHIAANEYLGTLQIHGVPQGKKGKVEMAVTLSLDPECQLTVQAKDAQGRELRTAVSMQYSAEELQKRLAITREDAQKANQARADDLRSRGGRFWTLLKRAVGRS